MNAVETIRQAARVRGVGGHGGSRSTRGGSTSLKGGGAQALTFARLRERVYAMLEERDE